MNIYLAGTVGKETEAYVMLVKINRLFSYIDLISKGRAFGSADRFKDQIKARGNKR